MTNDLQADLTADLLSDLGRTEPAPASSQAPTPTPVRTPAPAATPRLSVSLTPLHWSRPTISAPTAGAGVAVLVGPWRVEVAV